MDSVDLNVNPSVIAELAEVESVSSEHDSMPELESVTSEDEDRTPRSWVPCFQHRNECAWCRIHSLSSMKSSNTTNPSYAEEEDKSEENSEDDIPELITDDEMEASNGLSDDESGESEDENGYESGDEDMTPHTSVYQILHECCSECTPILYECQRRTDFRRYSVISGGHRFRLAPLLSRINV